MSPQIFRFLVKETHNCSVSICAVTVVPSSSREAIVVQSRAFLEAEPRTHVVVVGGGFIGLETAENK